MKLNLSAGFFRLTISLSIVAALVGFLAGIGRYGYFEDGILPAILLAATVWIFYLLIRFVVYGFLKTEKKDK